jgi:hypothetical protein
MENYNKICKTDCGVYYYLNDKLHRIDGPAIEYCEGDKSWYQNGELHRIDGQAYECVNGHKEWWQNDKLYRIDGPAVEYSDGDKDWYYKDQKIDCNSREEFERYIKLKLFW